MIVKECTLIKPLSCRPDENALQVAKLLRRNKQRRIIVVDNDNSPIGIVSTTDMNNRVVAENKSPQKTTAKDIMSSPIYLVCDINDDLNEVFKKMVEHESFFCPVTKNKKLYGVLTYGELSRRIKEGITNAKGKN